MFLRDPIDFFEEDGRTIRNINEVPPHVRRTIESIECTESPDGTVKIKLKAVSKYQCMELMAKHLGMLEPQKHQVEITQVDWREMYKQTPSNVVDAIEQRIIDEGK